MIDDAARKNQIPLCKQIQDHPPGDILIPQQIIVWILASSILVSLLLILPGEVTVDVRAAVKQEETTL